MARDNLSMVLAERPKESIIPGTTFNRKVSPAPTAADLKDGEILVESLYLAMEPSMKVWLSSKLTSDCKRLYIYIRKLLVHTCRPLSWATRCAALPPVASWPREASSHHLAITSPAGSAGRSMPSYPRANLSLHQRSQDCRSQAICSLPWVSLV